MKKLFFSEFNDKNYNILLTFYLWLSLPIAIVPFVPVPEQHQTLLHSLVITHDLRFAWMIV